MAKGSTVPPTMDPNISHGDKDEDEYEEDDWVVSLRDKGMSVFKVICKDKIACSHFFEILTTAIESQKLIWMHENTIDKKGALEREYADDVASLKNELEEEQTTKEALEETFALELSREKENHDRALEMANELKLKNDKLVFVNAKLLEDFEQLKKGSRVIESALAKLTESHEQLKASYLKKHANLPSPITTNNDVCATNSTSCEASILKENVELRAQLDLLTCNYGKLEENHGKLSRSHEDLLASHDRLKLAHEAIISKATPCSTSSSTCVVTNHVEEIKELKAQVTSLKNDLGSTVPPTMEPNISRGDKDEDEYEEDDWVVSLRDKGMSVFKVICKDKIACSHFFEILTTAIESQKLIWMHENTIDKKGALEREYADDVASLKNELEEEQTTKEALEETFALELSREKENHDRALEMANELKLKNDKLVFVNAKLLEDFEQLKKGSRVIESALAKLTESHEQLKASYLKKHANLPSPITTNNDACATNSTSCEASILKENVELRAQLDLLTCNYGKLEENHGKLSRSHEDLLASHDRLKLAHEAIISKATPCEPHVDTSTTTQNAILPCASPSNSSTHNIAKSCDELSSLPCCSNNEDSTSSSTCVVTNHVEEIKELKAQVTSLKNDLVKGHEGKCKLDTMLSMQQSPNDKSGLGFKSNNKNKSKNNNKKKGQVQVKDPTKIVCFKCNIEGHHVRSCPLKKKQKGKRPQAQTHIQPQVEEIPLPKKKQANAPIVEKPSEKKEKKRTCYICREKGHISSMCFKSYSIGQDKILKGASSNSSSLSHGPHICLMAKGSTVPPTMEPNISRGDKDEDEYEEDDWVVSLRDKGMSVFKVICKDKIACSHFFEILTTAIESQKLIWMHENTIDKKGALEREYADDVASLKNELEEEQTTKEALEETFALELSREKENHDRALEMANELKLKNDKLVFVNAKLLEDFEQLKKGSRVIESALAKLTESHEQLKASYLKKHANLPSPITTNNDACATNSTSCEASILKENVELRAQLDLLTCNYGKLEENHGKLSSSHEDLLASHDRLKLAHEAIISKATPCEPHVDTSTTTQNAILPCASPSNSSTHNIAKSCDELSSLPCCSNNEDSTSSSTCVVTNHVEEIKELKAQVTSLKNDLVKGHEGKCKLDTMLSMQQSPNDKSGLGFKSNNKNKSKNNNKKKGQVQVKDPTKIVCFKCNIEGHHVRSCPLKKKQKGKRPQAQTHIQPQVEEIPLPKKKQANAPIVEKPSEKKEKKRTCYICREKGHISTLCTDWSTPESGTTIAAGPSERRPAKPPGRADANCRACHLTYTWSKVWMMPRLVSCRAHTYTLNTSLDRLSGYPVNRLMEPIHP
ncbi:hypothetical protein QYE76_045996 [Lolium multiflorum]|uniref:CCHC-type domain-containing protein n=1 Tax=Lolium multiflorum TaxID=4521 RepID=A0AAD8TP37_LOLMU|nr:hypothetical protein QYE76_045996 [Lolium multiflorum]